MLTDFENSFAVDEADDLISYYKNLTSLFETLYMRPQWLKKRNGRQNIKQTVTFDGALPLQSKILRTLLYTGYNWPTLMFRGHWAGHDSAMWFIDHVVTERVHRVYDVYTCCLWLKWSSVGMTRSTVRFIDHTVFCFVRGHHIRPRTKPTAPSYLHRLPCRVHRQRSTGSSGFLALQGTQSLQP